MKKAILVLCLGIVVVFALSSVAYAGTTSGYLTPTGSPHGAYTTSSAKCGVCHAVHKATLDGQILMRGTAADACTYCHITTEAGLIKVYAGVEANYTSISKSAHDVGDATGKAACVGCHTPHGALGLVADHSYLEEKILKGEPVVEVASIDADDVAVSKWCTVCHSAASNGGAPYYETSYDTGATQRSHVMGPANVAYANGVATVTSQVAWEGSQTCRSCHADGLTNRASGVVKTVASSYPHFTVGERFLEAAVDSVNTGGAEAGIPATSSEADGVCIRCHVEAGGGEGGVGISY